jgi:hypothetical protein
VTRLWLFVSSRVGLAVLGLWLLGCVVSPATPQATPVASSNLLAGAPAEQRPSPVATLTPQIARMVLTTSVDAAETPAEELTTVPGQAAVIYLAVEVAQLPAGATLTVVWVHGGAEFARNDRLVAEPIREPRWLALSLRPASPLPGGEYAVRLLVNGQVVDSLVFTVSGEASGTPVAEQAIRLVFVAELPAEGGTVEPRSLFPAETRQVVAVLLDPPPETELVSRWYYSNGLLTEIPPDDLLSPSVRTFTLRSEQPLPVGSYRVEILAEGQAIASGEFLVQGGPAASSLASIEDFTVVAAIDPATQAPAGTPVVAVVPPITVYAAVLVRDLAASDLLEIVWARNDVEVARFPVTGFDLAYNWVSLPYEIAVQSTDQEVEYRAIVLLNGTPVRDHTFVVQP